MAQVIVYTQENGKIALCIPTGEISVEEVLLKDCPKGAIIVDDSTLPSHEFFDAWELVDGMVVVNESKKQFIIDAQQAPIFAKESALSKLLKLGLTPDEIKALVG